MNSWKNPQDPLISVIVPAHNEEEWIQDTLRTLMDQKTSVPYEIIVVDNASQDGTTQVAQAMGAKVIYEGKKSLPQARQAGYLGSHGKYLAYIDADSWAPPNWIESIDRAFNKYPQAAALYGTFRYRVKSKVHLYCCGFWFRYCLRVHNWFARGQNIAGCNFAVPRKTLEKINGFNLKIEFFGEDVDMANRIKRVGKIYPMNCRIDSSGRRFDEEGLFLPGILYFLNNIFIKVFKRPLIKYPSTTQASKLS